MTAKTRIPSQHTQALRSLFLCLKQNLAPLQIYRNVPLPIKIPNTGLLILRDGEIEEAEVTLSPTYFHYIHKAEIEVFVQNAEEEVREDILDGILSKIDAALNPDPTLANAICYAHRGPPVFSLQPVEGAVVITALMVPIFLEYSCC